MCNLQKLKLLNVDIIVKANHLYKNVKKPILFNLTSLASLVGHINSCGHLLNLDAI